MAKQPEFFRHIDIIRRPDGVLRDWDEHDALAQYENQCNLQFFTTFSKAHNGRMIKDKEYEERSRIQNNN